MNYELLEKIKMEELKNYLREPSLIIEMEEKPYCTSVSMV